MRVIVWCFSLFLVVIVCSPMGYALAESTPAREGPSILSASNTRNTAIERVPVDPNVPSYRSTIKASAAEQPDSGAVKQSNPSQESPPSPSGAKASFWQWISGKKVDCSSGVCTFK